MINLQSATICNIVQELRNRELNYIGVFNRAEAGESLIFDFATTWFGDNGDYMQDIKIISPSGKILAEDSFNFSIEEYYHTVITEFDIDIEEVGTYSIEIYKDNVFETHVPLIID